MFKDYGKYLLTSLKVYLFVLVIIFILKIVGLDYFGLDINNPIINNIEQFTDKNWIIRDIIYFIPLWLNQYIMVSVSANDNSKGMLKLNLIVIPIYYLLEVFKLKLFGVFSTIVEMLYFLILVVIYKKKLNRNIIKRFLFVMIGLYIIQIISTFTRFRYSIEYVNSFVENVILNLDYVVMLIIIYKINFMKGDNRLCYQVAQYSSSLKKINLKTLLVKLQENLHKFKKQDKETKLTYIFYFTFSLIWNTLSVVIILLVAKLNNTFIECLFILTSFWLSKRAFGKAFHLSSMTQCFIVSNLTYYALNRITTPLGISILIPILLGVGLSYVTSKFVKKLYKPLYKGMPKDLFEETILKVVDKDSIKYKICYDYFIEKKSALSLSYKYNYSEAGIRKIKDRINNKIKELN